MRKLTTQITIIVSLLTALTVSAAPDARVKGTIASVDLSSRTVTIAPRRGAEITLRVDEQTEIKRNGEPARLEDLQRGDRVQANYDSATLLASKIEARGPANSQFVRVEGVIAAVDTAGRTVTINPLRDRAPVTLRVTANTEITLDNRPARLEDLARGQNAGALFNSETFEAQRINAESFEEVRGVIRDVSVAAQTLTIERAGGEPPLTLNVTQATSIALNERPATLEDLARGYPVRASYVASTLTALRIAATSLAEVTGIIREVDTQSATVTIHAPHDGSSVELLVGRSTVITVNGEPARFEDLAAGMGAKAVYDIASHEAARIEARRAGDNECSLQRVDGAIASVDLEASTVTVDPREGERLVLNVTSRTVIKINGQPARLSDLQQGMRARVKFCRETLTATEIEARAASR